MARRAFTDKQRQFIAEYLIDLNATQAARRAGYSPRNADKIGPALLGESRIQAAIQAAMDKRSARTAITADRVLREYARIAFADMATFFAWGEDGVGAIPSSQLSADETSCVAEVHETTTDSDQGLTKRIRLKLHDKKAALDALAKHLKLDATLDREDIRITVVRKSHARPDR
jgi:phage terminase small subunit